MITTWSKGEADACMPQAMLVDTLEKVRRHPWWLCRAELALAVLRTRQILPPASIMDVGCGWGVNLDSLEQNGYQTTGLDISRQILEMIDQPARRLVEADINQLPPHELGRHDALLALDVLEHIDDDRQALQNIAPLLRPGGIAIVSVPAQPELFSEFDEIQGHRRRYLPDTLRAAFRDTGLDVQQIFWWGAWMVPALRRMRARQTKKQTYSDYLRLPPWPAPLLMRAAYAWEKNRALRGQLTTGTSLFAVATRQT